MEGGQRVREVTRDFLGDGLVSKSIRANYLDGQAGLFKLVKSFHEVHEAERET